MSSSLQQQYNAQIDPRRKKRGDSRLSKQTTRYQCYCDKTYLSYPALYLHLKNKHPECFSNNRKSEATRFKEFITQDGYKFLKMDKQAAETIRPIDKYITDSSFKPKGMGSIPFPNYYPFAFPSPPNFFPPNMEPKPYFMQPSYPNNIQKNLQQSRQPSRSMPTFDQQSFLIENSMKQTKKNKQVDQKQTIITIFNQYISDRVEELQMEKRQITELELLLSLFISCVREKDAKLKELFQINEDLLKTDNIKYLEVILPYFKNSYLPNSLASIKTSNPQESKEEKWKKHMFQTSRLLSNQSMRNHELQKLEMWLLKHELAEKFQSLQNL